MTQQQLARHSRDESALQRSHHTATKSLSNKMKKLPTLDVMEPTEMERYVTFSCALFLFRNVCSIFMIALVRYGTLNRKEQKTALRSAKASNYPMHFAKIPYSNISKIRDAIFRRSTAVF